MVYQQRHLDMTFAALADPTRREILAQLATGDRTISELAARFDMSLPGVSKHVRVLERAGLTIVERRGRARHARLRPAPMRKACDWIERYRRYWESELDQLAAYLEGTQPGHSPPEHPWSREAQAPPRSRRSKSAVSSARRGRVSSTRGRKSKS